MPKKTGIYLAEQPVFPLAGFVSIKESFANNRQAVLPEIGDDDSVVSPDDPSESLSRSPIDCSILCRQGRFSVNHWRLRRLQSRL